MRKKIVAAVLICFFAIAMVAGFTLTGCRKVQEIPTFHIACDAELFPVVNSLDDEFKKGFGVAIKPELYQEDELTFGENTRYDFLITDNLDFVETLDKKDEITVLGPFCYVTPAFICRKNDEKHIQSYHEIDKLADVPWRLIIASKCQTLQRITHEMLAEHKIATIGGQLQIAVVPMISPSQQISPLQFLSEGKTDMIVCWDFVAEEAVKASHNPDDYLVIHWESNEKNTVEIPICLLPECKDGGVCQKFVDFIKSSTGKKILLKHHVQSR